MKRREFGEPIKMHLVEEDRLHQLLMVEHMFLCGDRDRFEYFWDAMVESGCDQHVTHKEFVSAVEHMNFDELAEMDLALYEEYKEKKQSANVNLTNSDENPCRDDGCIRRGPIILWVRAVFVYNKRKLIFLEICDIIYM